MNFKLNTTYKKLLADTFTPVSLYLKLRDKFPNSILLESSDYHGNQNTFSYICCKPIAGIKLENELFTSSFPDGSINTQIIDASISVPDEIRKFAERFDISESEFKFINNGLFGYIAYDSVRYFEDIAVDGDKKESKKIPDVIYNVYQYVIAIDHFKDELFIFEHTYGSSESTIDLIEGIISNKNFASYKFNIHGKEESNFTDNEFMEVVGKGKMHCRRGDVFQVVLSREFSRKFTGDDFNVYRSLRSVNPSPYLFYFDYGNFKLFGSSPEAQLVVDKDKAFIHPIAGTFKRTGDDESDAAAAEKLKLDPKETAEHIMLVDLARNDLSRNCSDVKVETLREIQYYSHVIHLVSNVSGKLKPGASTTKIIADTFPAGTLSGAPKHKAMQLINTYEKGNRSFYGGCIGFMGFPGQNKDGIINFNHAIMIRSFLSKNNCLFYQAGAGVVVSSDERSELNEVNNKLAALKKAIDLAIDI
ncbi:MAG: anthranilate synthase component I family protein [Bacteroidetes bacterium]|nr:anthranilate synthase component I family protein [Bacteroidota bacterium]